MAYAYNLTDAQKKTCNRIREQSIAEQRRGMGEQFEEARGLREQKRDRIKEYIHEIKQERNGAPGPSKVGDKFPGVKDDLVLRSLNERLKEIDRRPSDRLE